MSEAINSMLNKNYKGKVSFNMSVAKLHAFHEKIYMDMNVLKPMDMGNLGKTIPSKKRPPKPIDTNVFKKVVPAHS